MKRAFLRKVKSISCSPCPTTCDEMAQVGQNLSGAKRRARTSAAMVGLALSMGATGLLVPRQGDGASAAEPQGSEAASPISRGVAPGSSLQAPVVDTINHTVRAGQTLEKVARQYQVTVEELAATNQLGVHDALRVGQVLKVPATEAALKASARSTQLMALAELSSLPATDASASGSASQIQANRDQSLNRLKQQREKLKEQLAELRRGDVQSASTPSASTISAKPISQTQNQLIEQGTPSPTGQAQSQVVAQVPNQVAVVPITTFPSPLPAAGRSVNNSNGLVAASPAPELDWMRVNQSLEIPAPAAGLTGSQSSESLSRPSVTLPTRVAASQSGTSPLALQQDYQVSPGDTAVRIARAHNISLSALVSANRLSDPNVIFVGQRLRLPVSQIQTPQTITKAAEQPTLPSVVPSSTAANSSAIDDLSARTTLPTVPRQSRANSVAIVPSSIAPSPALSPISPDLPTVPPTSSPEQVQGTAGNSYVQGLLSEVRALREKRLHQAKTDATAVDQNASANLAAANLSEQVRDLPVAERVTPAAERPTAINPQAVLNRSANTERQAAPTTLPRVPQQTRVEERTPTVVAVAPLNPESYAPLTEQVPGRMVSPDLPALPDANRFLPDGVMNGYIWPARGVFTSGYGWRWGRMHQGIDIAADVGTPIYAAASGVVEYAGWNSGGYGNMVEVRHRDGSMTRYAHMNALYVQKGQQVTQAEQIGEMGSTGYSTGPHLHFEVHLADQGTVNPMAYLPPQ